MNLDICFSNIRAAEGEGLDEAELNRKRKKLMTRPWSGDSGS